MQSVCKVDGEAEKRHCHAISCQRKVVLAGKSMNCFVCGSCIVTLELLVQALESIGNNQFVFYAYGMTVEDSYHLYMDTNFLKIQLLNADGTPAIDQTPEDKIPIFILDESLVEGKVFPML